ncbi:MBL fold metallo-hydrolase [Arthrobacter sp. RAF14]|uniref:MBL fold metallo-hydrolase n=1 Tax=Arthrobacter sp. RAF14 TaxID=3233051 RepID=UPI003F93C20A
MILGDIQILPLLDGTGTEKAGEILSRPGVPDAWACHPEHFGEDGHWEIPLGGFLVRTGDRTVLVDTGVGAFDDGKYRGGGLPEALRAAGSTPEEVTDVVFTHLHFDHIGWASLRGEAVFPRATYRVHQADWEHFVSGPQASADAVEKLLPVQDRFEPFARDFTLAAGIDAVHVPGHTPGSTVYVVSSQGLKATLLGDVAHSEVQLGERDWQVVWDHDPEAASALRNRIADGAADTPELLAAAHFPGMRFGRVITSRGRREFLPL